MRRHETPKSVANALAKHAPKEFRSLLDPAAGAGALIEPLLGQVIKSQADLYCVDIDSKAILEVESTIKSAEFSEKCNYQLIQDDFLTWSQGRANEFDCIVMNPPFAAVKTKYRQFTYMDGGNTIHTHLPVEAAFLYRAIDLLTPGGCMLAVLPCSIVMGITHQWLRDRMFSLGAVKSVHELPPRTFPNVESRIYLLVFEKAKRQRIVSLFNHDLVQPEELRLNLAHGEVNQRLDFGFHKARLLFKDLESQDRFGWKQLENVAEIIRGDACSPEGPKRCVHTNDFRDGFWRRSDRHIISAARSSGHLIKKEDLLVKRVGRGASSSFGRHISLQELRCSDCIFIIRPRMENASMPILFALKVLFTVEGSDALIERGTGAAYISSAALKNLAIPAKLHARFPRTFKSFTKSELIENWMQSKAIIAKAGRYLKRTKSQ